MNTSRGDPSGIASGDDCVLKIFASVNHDTGNKPVYHGLLELTFSKFLEHVSVLLSGMC